MKTIQFALCLLLLSATTVAQKREPVNTKKDQRQFRGYNIRLVPAKEGTYGYEVTQGSKRVIYQMQNPFTESLRGMSKKEDAFAVAQYQIKQLKAKSAVSPKTGRITTNQKRSAQATNQPASSSADETIYNQRLSPKVAEQLKISITR